MGLEAHIRLSGDIRWLSDTETWLKLLQKFEKHDCLRSFNWVSGEISPEKVPELYYALKGLDITEQKEMVARENLLEALQCCYDSRDVMVIQ